MREHRLPAILGAAWIVLAVITAIDPADRHVWVVEFLPVFMVVAVLALTYRMFRFSDTSYLLMAVWIFWHNIGAYYTFGGTPFDSVSGFFGWERNQFDRVAHLVVGFYAYPMMEWLLRKGYAGVRLAGFFALFFIMSLAAGYEIVEWVYAELEGGDVGVAFVGAQGDVWDAQKDMLLDTVGALLAIGLYLRLRPDRHSQSA